MTRELSPRTLSCPTCKSRFPVGLARGNKGSIVPASEGGRPPYLPFCSERCKMADLGRWLGGEYSVPSDEPPTEEAYLEALREQDLLH